MSLKTQQNDHSLRTMFETVMNVGNDEFSNILKNAGHYDDLDIEFLREIAGRSLISLHATVDTLQDEASTIRRQADYELVSFGNSSSSLVESTDALEVTFQRQLKTIQQNVLLEANHSLFQSGLSRLESHQEEKKLLRQLLANSESLIEFVELPTLVQSCISSGYYPEAVRLFQYFHRLSSNVKRQFSSCDLFNKVFKEMNASGIEFAKHLERSLQLSLSADEARNLLTVIQQHNPTFIEESVRRYFLTVKLNQYLEKKDTLGLKSPNASTVKDYMHLVSVNLVDTLRQDETLFGESNSTNQGLSKFVRLEVHEIISLFEDSLILKSLFQKGNLVAARELLESLLELNNRLRTVNAGIEEDVIANIFLKHYSQLYIESRLNVEKFQKMFSADIRSHKWDEPFTSFSSISESVMQLTRHKPIGLLFNQLVLILNEVRHLALPAIAPLVVKCVDEILLACWEILSNVSPASAEHRIAKSHFSKILLVYVEHCLNLLFEGTAIQLSQTRERVVFDGGLVD